jgi:hypothetical protein
MSHNDLTAAHYQWIARIEGDFHAAIVRKIYELEDAQVRRLPEDGWVCADLRAVRAEAVDSASASIAFGPVEDIVYAGRYLDRTPVMSFTLLFEHLYELDDELSLDTHLAGMSISDLRERCVRHVLNMRPAEVAVLDLVESEIARERSSGSA